MKKILAILTSEVFYGKERANVEVYHLLKRNGYNLKVVVNTRTDARLISALEGIDTYAIDYPNRHDKSQPILKFLFLLLRANFQLLGILLRYRPTCLFLNTEFNLFDLYPVLALYKGKMVYRIGDAPGFPHLKFSRINTFIWNRIALNKVNTFVFDSDFIKDQVNKTGRKNEHDVKIYSIPPTRIKKETSFVVEKNYNELVFGYIGQITPIKGVDIFVQSANRLYREGVKCKFLIAGNLLYAPEFTKIIQELASSNPMITFLGEIDDIESFYKNIDVLCVPSVYQEPYGLVIVEAKQYSRPCVIFPSGGMPELIRHNEDGYVCKDRTPESLYEGMKYFCDNRNKIDEFKTNSHASIQKLEIDKVSFERKWNAVFNGLFG